MFYSMGKLCINVTECKRSGRILIYICVQGTHVVYIEKGHEISHFDFFTLTKFSTDNKTFQLYMLFLDTFIFMYIFVWNLSTILNLYIYKHAHAHTHTHAVIHITHIMAVSQKIQYLYVHMISNNRTVTSVICHTRDFKNISSVFFFSVSLKNEPASQFE